MIRYFINAIAIFITARIITKIPCCQNSRAGLDIEKLAKAGEITAMIGNTVYTVKGYFKPTGRTLTEKLMRNMEKELDNGDAVCYNITKSQKSLDCKQDATGI